MRYCKIKPNDVINGEGIMVSLWTQGCPHQCKGCFNKDTWDFNKGEEFTTETMREIARLLRVNNVKRNLAILGGEPLCKENISGVIALCKFIKYLQPETKIFVWTGYLFEDLIEKYGYDSFKEIDVLIDGKFEESLKDITLPLRGSTNQRIFDIKKCEKTTINNKN